MFLETGLLMRRQENRQNCASAVGAMERQKVVIPATLTVPEIMEQFRVSRTTAWRAKSRGWLFTRYHDREVVVDKAWASAHYAELQESAQKGVLSYLLSRAANAGRTVRELCAPFEPEDAIQEALVRLQELSGHPDRHKEGWQVKVAKNAAADFMDHNLVRTRRHINFDNLPLVSKDTGEEDIEVSKARLADIVPSCILDLAERILCGERLTKKEHARLGEFRANYGWLMG